MISNLYNQIEDRWGGHNAGSFFHLFPCSFRQPAFPCLFFQGLIEEQRGRSPSAQCWSLTSVMQLSEESMSVWVSMLHDMTTNLILFFLGFLKEGKRGKDHLLTATDTVLQYKTVD